jgi:hypothetical protein
MRWASGVFCVILVLFAAVQWNDPDATLWGAIYLIAGIWAGVAAFRPAWLGGSVLRLAFVATCMGAVYGLIHYWPADAQWWMQDVWWEVEAAREGMGMMIVTAALAVAAGAAMLRRT